MTASSIASVQCTHGPLSLQSWDGTGTEALLIHGVDGDSGAFNATAVDVSGARPLTAVDLRGRGHSPLQGPWGVGAHAADIISILDKRESSVTLVGHSFGGHVAALAAACRPEKVNHLVLVDGGLRRMIPEDKTPMEVAAFIGQNILAKLEDQPDHPLSAEALEADLASMMTDGSAELVVTVPITVLRAGQGVAPGLPPVVPEAAVNALPATTQVREDIVVPGATHFSLLDQDRSDLVAVLSRT